VTAIAAASFSAAAAETKSGGETAPLEQTLQFMRSEGGRPQVWLVAFKIAAPHAEDLNKVHIAQPRIVDGLLVKLTSGETAARRPEISELKQAIMEAIVDQVGTVEGLDVSIQKLGRN